MFQIPIQIPIPIPILSSSDLLETKRHSIEPQGVGGVFCLPLLAATGRSSVKRISNPPPVVKS